MRRSDDILGAVQARERIAAVRATGLLDTPSEEEFDRLTRLAAKLTGAPITFTSLVSGDRDFYKSSFGFPEPLASEREICGTTFCHYALVSEGPLIIESTVDHPIYRDVPTVTSLGVRAYLGVPLINSAGHAIGSFCAIDVKPRKWTPLDVEVMQELGASTLREIELRGALRNLDAEQRRLDVLLQHIPVGVVFAEAKSRSVLRNRQAQEILHQPEVGDLGYTEQWVGFHADGARIEPREWPIARALRGEVVNGEEILLERVDGVQTWLRLHAAPVLDVDGGILGGVIAFHDIDKERLMAIENSRLYSEAQQAIRAKDEFFAAVTHELRTPMTAIIGWAGLLKAGGLSEGEVAEAVEAITSGATMQAQVVDDLLDVSRTATGKLSLKREPLSLNDVVSEAVLAIKPNADSKQVSVRTSMDGDSIVLADRGRMRQIVSNLLSNALKFTPIGGLIRVSASSQNEFASVVVKDTGSGIDPAFIPFIFERFRQAKSAEHGGLGLGLAIVESLVELHGGDVRAESEGPGKGSTFTVRLPLHQM